MHSRRIYQVLSAASLALAVAGCKLPEMAQRNVNRGVPATYNTGNSQDTISSARVRWKEFFTDPNLVALIDTALNHNQELNITLQEIQIARNEIQARKGEYLPSVGLAARAEAEKPGRYTLQGATEDYVKIQDRHPPTPLANYQIGAFASWEVDIWHKLRNARKSAATRYLASVEGKNFMITNLIAEIATSYYELLALDNQLAIIRQNIVIQENALRIVKQEMQSARVTELAVKRFEAQVQHTIGLQFQTQQRIVETENRINFLLGRFPQPITRNDDVFNGLVPPTIQAGVPAQLLSNRPDIRQAEQQLVAAKLDVRVARANFYPTLDISANAGFAAFKPGLLFNSPESMLYNLAGDLVAPLVNRNGIKALYATANALQLQAVYNYEQTVLNAYLEVANQLSNINNLAKSYDAKLLEVQALSQSIRISNSLFKAVRAEYTEVLFTQRDALESKFDIIDIKLQQLNATVNTYRALGGGWQ